MISNRELVPCEYCLKIMHVQNIHVHQSECQSNISVSYETLLREENGVVLNESRHNSKNDIKLPCEFCKILIIANNLICHQISCRRSYGKVNKNYSNTSENNIALLTETNLHSKNKFFCCTYSDEFFKELSNTLKTKNSIKKSNYTINWKPYPDKIQTQNILSELNSSGYRINYPTPTLILRKPKLTNYQLNQSTSYLKNNNFLSIKYNTDFKLINDPVTTNLIPTEKMFKKHGKYHKWKNVSISEHLFHIYSIDSKFELYIFY